MVKATFFDRDGVLSALVDKHAPWSYREFKVYPEVYSALSITRDLGFMNLVISNQPDIESGKLHMDDLEMMNAILTNEYPVDDISFCTDRLSNHYKPKPGMVEDYAAKYGIDLSKSYLVGDRWRDIVLAHNLGITSILVVNNTTQQDWPPEHAHIKADHEVMNVFDACLLIKRLEDDRNIL